MADTGLTLLLRCQRSSLSPFTRTEFAQLRYKTRLLHVCSGLRSNNSECSLSNKLLGVHLGPNSLANWVRSFADVS